MVDEDLARALEAPVTPPTARDWSFRWNVSEGGFNRYGWGSADQTQFDTAWDSSADQIAYDLIDNFAWAWPWLMSRAARARHPDLVGRLLRLSESGLIGGQRARAGLHDIVVDHALMYGAFDHIRERSTWPDPGGQSVCPICTSAFTPETLSPWMLIQFGRPRYCPSCCCRVRNGAPSRDAPTLLRVMRRLADALSTIPGAGIAGRLPLAALETERRDEVVRALICLPHDVRPHFDSWLKTLIAAGLVRSGWRPGRGTYCLAADGHPCRSIAEQAIDDFLSANNIEHEVEPRWPSHAKWNPSGARRADWRILVDGTYVEFAGMLADEKYAAKMNEKRSLAVATGIRLVVLLPEDLPNLRVALRPWLATGTTPKASLPNSALQSDGASRRG